MICWLKANTNRTDVEADTKEGIAIIDGALESKTRADGRFEHALKGTALDDVLVTSTIQLRSI